MSIPPAIRDYVAQEIAKALPNSQTLAGEISQLVEASISSGLANILNAKTAAMRQDIDDALAAISARLNATPDTSALAADVSRTVEASISSGLASIVEAKANVLRDELTAEVAKLQEFVDRCERSSQSAHDAVADLDARLRKWLDEDRYTLTRAHVTKIMREQNG